MEDNLQQAFEVERQGLKFSLASSWNDEALDKVCKIIRNPRAPEVNSKELSEIRTTNTPTSLSGRGVIKFIDLPEVGSVAVKQYRRGGLLSLLVKERYFSSDPPRPAVEWETLRQAQRLGVNVPTPLGYAIEGSIFYRAWLFTKEIPKHQSLSEIACCDLSRLAPLVDNLVAQVCILIASGIRHIDLHPGNVVVSESNEVFLLDFDKAENVKLEKKDLRDQYVWRWRRAVIKHKLPEQLSELFCLGLRRSAITD